MAEVRTGGPLSELPPIPEKMYAYTPLFNDAKNVVTIVGFVRGLIDREQTAGADDHRFTVQPSYLLDSRPHLQHATYVQNPDGINFTNRGHAAWGVVHRR